MTRDNNLQRRHLLRAAAGTGLGLLGTGSLWAQASAWPSKPVNLVVPFPAGGGTDAFARPLAAQFAKSTGKMLVIDNRGGAGGTVGASFAARAAADGYTLFMGGVHHSIAPAMYPKLDYDIEKDFIPLALLARVPQVVVVNPKIPSANFKQFLDHVKRNPAKLNYGSAGAGTSHHLAGELFKQQTSTFITHIPYRGIAPATLDTIGGQLQLLTGTIPALAPHIREGKLKALAVTSPKRLPAYPDVPAIGEVLPGYESSAWFGLFGPGRMAPDVARRFSDAARQAIATPEVRRRIEAEGASPVGNTPAEFAAFVHDEIGRWAKVVKFSGAKPE